MSLDRAVGIKPGGFLTNVVIHKRFPLAVEGHATEVEQRLGARERPVHPGPFRPVLDDMTAGPFDHPGGDGITGGKVPIIGVRLRWQWK